MAKSIIKAKIFRYNPDTDMAPTYKTYEVPWEAAGSELQEEKGNVMQLLKTIYEDLDRSLAFPYFACGFKFCNGCMMTINGVPTHACAMQVAPGDELVIEPMKGYPIIRDLIVDWGRKVTSADGTSYEISKGAVVKEVKLQS